jgi:hypothetical protein
MTSRKKDILSYFKTKDGKIFFGWNIQYNPFRLKKI